MSDQGSLTWAVAAACMGLTISTLMACGGAKPNPTSTTSGSSSGGASWEDLCKLAEARAKRCNLTDETNAKALSGCASLQGCLTSVYDASAASVLADCLKSDDCDACYKAAVAKPSAAGAAYKSAASAAKTCDALHGDAPLLVSTVGLLYNDKTLQPYLACAKGSCDDARACGTSADDPGVAYCVEDLVLGGGVNTITQNGQTTPIPKDTAPDILGKPAVELSGELVDGGKMPSIKGSSGKGIVLHFWTSTDANSVKSLGDAEAFAKKYKAQVVVIAVSEDKDEKALKAFLKKKKVSVPVVWDSKNETAKAYQATAMPVVVIIDTKGVALDRMDTAFDAGGTAARLAL